MSVFSPKRLLALGRGQGLRAELLRGGAGVAAFKVLSLPLTLLAAVVLARGLGPEGYGKFSFLVALITVLAIPLGPALMLLATREIAALTSAAEFDRIHSFVAWASRRVWLGSLMTIVLAGGYAASVAEWHTDDRCTLFLVVLVALPFLGLNQVRAGVLTGLRRVVLAQLPELFIRPVILLVLAVMFAAMGGLSPLTALVAFVSAGVIASLVGALLIRSVLPQARSSKYGCASDAGDWHRAWGPFTFLVFASTLNSQLGILFLGWLSTDEEVAAMQVADRGAILVALSVTVVNLVIGPHIAQAFRQGDRKRLQLLFRQSSRAAFFVALPIAIPLLFFGRQILELVFGAQYAEIATLPLGFLVAGRLVFVVFGTVGMFLAMSGFERDTMYGHAIALVVNAVVAVALIPKWGATGAAIAASLGLIIWSIVLAVLFSKRLGIRVSGL